MPTALTPRHLHPVQFAFTLNGSPWPSGHTFAVSGFRTVRADVSSLTTPSSLNSISTDDDYRIGPGDTRSPRRFPLVTGWEGEITVSQVSGTNYSGIQPVVPGTCRIKIDIDNGFDPNDYRYESGGSFSNDVAFSFADVAMTGGSITQVPTVTSSSASAPLEIASITGPKAQPNATLVDVTVPATINLVLTEIAWADVPSNTDIHLGVPTPSRLYYVDHDGNSLTNPVLVNCWIGQPNFKLPNLISVDPDTGEERRGGGYWLGSHPQPGWGQTRHARNWFHGDLSLLHSRSGTLD